MRPPGTGPCLWAGFAGLVMRSRRTATSKKGAFFTEPFPPLVLFLMSLFGRVFVTLFCLCSVVFVCCMDKQKLDGTSVMRWIAYHQSVGSFCEDPRTNPSASNLKPTLSILHGALSLYSPKDNCGPGHVSEKQGVLVVAPADGYKAAQDPFKGKARCVEIPEDFRELRQTL